MQSCQPVTSYRTKPSVNSKLVTRAVDAHPEWLPQIANFNIFVLAHKNANEPETVADLWQQFSQVLW